MGAGIEVTGPNGSIYGECLLEDIIRAVSRNWLRAGQHVLSNKIKIKLKFYFILHRQGNYANCGSLCVSQDSLIEYL